MASAVSLVAGLGATLASLASGIQETPGRRFDKVILLVLGAYLISVGVGIWLERTWAWWVGFATTLTTVLGDLLLDATGGGSTAGDR